MESYENSGSYLEKLGESGLKVKIEKLGIKPGKKSKTRVGKTIELDLYVPIRPGLPIRKIREIDNPDPSRQKRGIGITSPVVSILKISDTEYLVETATSTYRLYSN
jgi:hypothetical protein